MAREVMQRFSHAAIHGGGTDCEFPGKKLPAWLRSLGPLEAAGEARALAPSGAVRWHVRVPRNVPQARRRTVGGNSCSSLRAVFRAKPRGAVSGFATRSVSAAYSQILLLSVLGLIWGGLKESTLGRIARGEDT